ncbi:superkiller complex protein 2 [Anabrus simplex]|uniref:superkiller complex protein 2 n=1 Tax=Anabrus simplex TaxID=316456 RepID=UPI0035A2BD70
MPPELSEKVDVQLFYGPPPVLPDVEKQLRDHLLGVDRLPIHNFENAQQLWPRQPDFTSLYHYESSPLGTTLKVDRDPTTGEVLQFREVPVEDTGCNAKNSMSLRRAPGPSTQSVRGTDANYPFWPGGFPELSTQDTQEDEAGDINFEDDLLYIAPGLERGIKFKADGRTPCKGEDEAFPELKSKAAPVEKPAEKESSPAPSLMDIIQQEENLLGLWKESAPQDEQSNVKDATKTIVQTMKVDSEEEMKVIPEKVNLSVLKKIEPPVLKISNTPSARGPTVAEWAELIDISQPVTDFEEKIPNPAITYSFELDNFQKQAILKVEEHSNVFVAAHTSAGKTVVAEYAIALSLKHMTRTVYTSPIKALSNQKFRDFKEKFQTVGLITGDMQLNPTASCLIMTTEILRSMLYQGSEVVRDLEYVIFDEVHYINNIERGHVWEEALILLPESVCIIMLSATVPNTLEFANWVGRTKGRKMYVISTLRRPVPLKHYLYTGSTGKPDNQLHLILDENESFVLQGYQDACEAMDTRKNKAKKQFGPRQGYIPLTEKQEASMWQALINSLDKNDKLPIVAFTLSRNRCDTNAKNLMSVDKTTAREKHFIHNFFQTCLRRLKEPDRELPQVKQMEKLLMKGLGVHHSGILPILKEIVEFLFQEGKVKVLFATETFAMGVNMPARTVIFDSIRKFDGQGMRPLLPAEYIQMAGRAGRRNMDSTGHVIIVCKAEVPKLEDLKAMMLGKPEKLTSQFRLTYAMILRLLRVEKISVEDMMSRSFMEFGKQSRQENYLNDMRAVDEKIAKLVASSVRLGNTEKLTELYLVADKYLQIWNETRPAVMSNPKVLKDIVPGRVLLINHKEHVSKFAMLLRIEQKDKQNKAYKVLVLCNDENSMDMSGTGEIRLSLKSDPEQKPKERSDTWYKMMALVYNGQIFMPDGIGHHKILTINSNDIARITREGIRGDPEVIIHDYEERQLPRFRNRPPGQTCLQAVQELTRFSLNPTMVAYTYMPSNLDTALKAQLDRLWDLQETITAMNFAHVPNFQEQFETIFERKQLEKQKDTLMWLQSNQSMQLYPDYQGKVRVLRDMGYIEKNNAVDMKGRVAIKMRNNELIITELVLQNILKDMPAPEIAALLSSLVFQQKTKSKPPLTESLKKGIDIFLKIEADIQRCEQDNCVEPGVDNQGLNFGLVRVVYEWALEKPFAEIIKLTDVQEGIVVRCIQQLNDTLRDVKDAASSVGDTMLSTKMDEAARAIKRDIVFAASLYTSDTIHPSAIDSSP